MTEGWISNRVARHELQIGDHIYVYRAMRTYSHHGILVKPDRVIHFLTTGDSGSEHNFKPPCKNCGHRSKVDLGVVKTCLDCFVAKGNLFASSTIRRYQYSVSKLWYKMAHPGTCSTFDPKPSSEVVKTAMAFHSRPNSFGEYNLASHNCENFATFCKSGQTVSAQVKRTALYLGIFALVASGGTAAVVIAGISYQITKTSKEFIKKHNINCDNLVLVTGENGDQFGVINDKYGVSDIVKLSVTDNGDDDDEDII